MAFFQFIYASIPAVCVFSFSFFLQFPLSLSFFSSFFLPMFLFIFHRPSLFHSSLFSLCLPLVLSINFPLLSFVPLSFILQVFLFYFSPSCFISFIFYSLQSSFTSFFIISFFFCIQSSTSFISVFFFLNL